MSAAASRTLSANQDEIPLEGWPQTYDAAAGEFYAAKKGSRQTQLPVSRQIRLFSGNGHSGKGDPWIDAGTEVDSFFGDINDVFEHAD